jgi:hypothetical protein
LDVYPREAGVKQQVPSKNKWRDVKGEFFIHQDAGQDLGFMSSPRIWGDRARIRLLACDLTSKLQPRFKVFQPASAGFPRRGK